MIDGNMTVQAISPKDLLVYLCLRRYRNPDTGESIIPVTKIVKQTGASPVTVLKCLERLEATGHISYSKQGRANVYVFKTNIEASSYAFLDSKLSCQDKIAAAVNAAFVEGGENSGEEIKTNRLYDYVVRLEEQIVRMDGKIQVLSAELDRTRKVLSAITGQEYVPLDI